MRFYLIIILLFFLGCNIGVNTSDPQITDNINTSKKEGFFIREYYADTSAKAFFDVSECWLEYSWKNEIVNSKPIKQRTGGAQLNFNIQKIIPTELNSNKYFIDWKMDVENIGGVGRQGNIFFMFVSDNFSADSVKINIKKINKDRSSYIYRTFWLKKSPT